ALWDRAVKASPTDGQGWLAVGDLASDTAVARDAYQRAAKLATAPRQRRTALTKLIGAAKRVSDTETVDTAYSQLIDLAPKDGLLWLERGSAQLEAGKVEAASTSFVTAEQLLATDPERRLAAMMNQGVALQRLGRTDDAIAQYLRTLDKMPRGYYLG